ncbi:hypothetical protein CEXT_54991 [Caerostris extrusa]|uniref:Uncharacterized protein n=1 Tax=Caerostris extrusa TaxID=172846 RepID=A0AAV4RM71_CAEEX|nr:hypothetical protein CEXT_54991 [Caerostris extrusa]
MSDVRPPTPIDFCLLSKRGDALPTRTTPARLQKIEKCETPVRMTADVPAWKNLFGGRQYGRSSVVVKLPFIVWMSWV